MAAAPGLFDVFEPYVDRLAAIVCIGCTEAEIDAVRAAHKHMLRMMGRGVRMTPREESELTFTMMKLSPHALARMRSVWGEFMSACQSTIAQRRAADDVEALLARLALA